MDENSSHELNNASSPLPASSTPQEQIKMVSESFGNVSERNKNVSEPTHNFSESENQPFRKRTKASEKTDIHTLTVRETAKIFEDSGVLRTERSIINWCNQNSQGECRLDCFYDDVEHKYFITPQSIHKVIKEEKEKARDDTAYLRELSENRQEFSESFGKTADNFPNPSEKNKHISETIPKASERLPNEEKTNDDSVENSHEESEANNKRIIEMELELNKLREEKIRAESSTGYKDELLTFFKNQIANDREDYNSRMQFMQEQIIKLQEHGNKYVDQAIESQRRIGSLESQLRQLEAPKSEPKYEKSEPSEFKYRDADIDRQAPQSPSSHESAKPEEPVAPRTDYEHKVEEPLENQNNYEQNHERVSIHSSSSGEQNHFSPEDEYPRQ